MQQVHINTLLVSRHLINRIHYPLSPPKEKQYFLNGTPCTLLGLMNLYHLTCSMGTDCSDKALVTPDRTICWSSDFCRFEVHTTDRECLVRYRILIASSDWFLRPVTVNVTRGRANDRTITELLVGSCTSRRRSCNQSAPVVRRCMFSHSEVLRDVARLIVRG